MRYPKKSLIQTIVLAKIEKWAFHVLDVHTFNLILKSRITINLHLFAFFTVYETFFMSILPHRRYAEVQALIVYHYNWYEKKYEKLFYLQAPKQKGVLSRSQPETFLTETEFMQNVINRRFFKNVLSFLFIISVFVLTKVEPILSNLLSFFKVLRYGMLSLPH